MYLAHSVLLKLLTFGVAGTAARHALGHNAAAEHRGRLVCRAERIVSGRVI
jgi:hypothetical protein